jgi:predicted acetyltransferase
LIFVSLKNLKYTHSLPESAKSVLMFYFQEINHNQQNALRLDYLKSLPVFQDYFIEIQVQFSECLGMYNKDRIIGFVALNQERTLTGFYIDSDGFPDFNPIQFRQILNQLEITTIYCQSFDHVLINLCLRNNFSPVVIGCIYRDWYIVKFGSQNNVTFRFAEAEDLDFLIQQDDEVFEPKELLSAAIQKKEIIFFLHQTQIIGCGFRTRIHPQFNYYDIGVWVHPVYRKKGYATHIMIWLKENCIQNNWIPTCGCDISNVASQHTLAKAGFVSKYSLLEFSVPPQ